MKTQTPSQSPAPSAQRKTAPEMPQIPGVYDDVPETTGFQPKPLIAVILATLLCASAFTLWLLHRRNTGPKASASTATLKAPTSSGSSTAKTESDPNAIATLYDLAAPWSSKAFYFTDPKTHQTVPAMIIHLPSPPAEPSFWAFSLTNPYSRCQLQFETDLGALSQRFTYSAVHPMVVSDCDGILYDPLKMATLPDGSWVRGDIVRGGGIRPPISIQVEVHGRDIVAERME